MFVDYMEGWWRDSVTHSINGGFSGEKPPPKSINRRRVCRKTVTVSRTKLKQKIIKISGEIRELSACEKKHRPQIDQELSDIEGICKTLWKFLGGGVLTDPPIRIERTMYDVLLCAFRYRLLLFAHTE